jgi:hypothetical protein
MILQLLDLLIGLSVIYVIFSSIASALAELVEARLKMRGRLLRRGIAELFDYAARACGEDGGERRDKVQQMVTEFYRSPHINSLFRNPYEPDRFRNLPSYIPPARFAAAVIRLSEGAQFQREFAAVRTIIGEVAGPDAIRDLKQLQAVIAGYFEDSMQRVSGWYRRHVQLVLLGLGLLLAALFNIDSLRLIQRLSQDAVVRDQLVSKVLSQSVDAYGQSAPEQCGADGEDCAAGAERFIRGQSQLAASLDLPIGWDLVQWQELFKQRSAETTSDPFFKLLAKLLGLALTAIALSFGAPFWFDVLNRLISLRAAVKPPPVAKQEPGKEVEAEVSAKLSRAEP